MTTCLRINDRVFYPVHNYESDKDSHEIVLELIANAWTGTETAEDVTASISTIEDLVKEAIKFGKQELLEEMRQDGFDIGTDCDGVKDERLPEVPGVRPEPCRCAGTRCEAIGISVDDEGDKRPGKIVCAEGDGDCQVLGHTAGADNYQPVNLYAGLHGKSA